MLWPALAFIVIGALLTGKGKKEQDTTTRIAGIIIVYPKNVVGLLLSLKGEF